MTAITRYDDCLQELAHYCYTSTTLPPPLPPTPTAAASTEDVAEVSRRRRTRCPSSLLRMWLMYEVDKDTGNWFDISPCPFTSALTPRSSKT